MWNLLAEQALPSTFSARGQAEKALWRSLVPLSVRCAVRFQQAVSCYLVLNNACSLLCWYLWGHTCPTGGPRPLELFVSAEHNMATLLAQTIHDGRRVWRYCLTSWPVCPREEPWYPLNRLRRRFGRFREENNLSFLPGSEPRTIQPCSLAATPNTPSQVLCHPVVMKLSERLGICVK